jgi:hypothetical protein
VLVVLEIVFFVIVVIAVLTADAEDTLLLQMQKVVIGKYTMIWKWLNLFGDQNSST